MDISHGRNKYQLDSFSKYKDKNIIVIIVTIENESFLYHFIIKLHEPYWILTFDAIGGKPPCYKKFLQL